MVSAEIRKSKFVEWYSRYGTPAKMGLYFNALEDPNAVLDYRATHPARPEFHQDVDRSLFPAPGHSIYEITELSRLKLLFENSNQVKTADDGSIKSGIGNYVMWLRLWDPETWKDEPFWDGDCVAAGTPTGRTRMATLLKNGFDYLKELEYRKATYKMDRYLAAIRTKPFVLLAGISGTGKSRLVRQLARGFCPAERPLADEKKPGNFEMIQVRPNWHDSTELLGYVSRVSGKPEYVVKDFVTFLVKAWMYPKVPFFLCLDEMNLAPVEQYFAEYLSVIETRQKDGDAIVTDPIVRFEDAVFEQAFRDLLEPYAEVPQFGTDDEKAALEALTNQMKSSHALSIPQNLVVIGTVNMDETTFSFSRKVLDRAMSFELNEVNMRDGLTASTKTPLGAFKHDGSPLQRYIEADEVYPSNKDLCDKVLGYLETVNEKLDKTPFKIAYRSRNEIMVYCVERTKDGAVSLEQALDEATSMKILSRIEGDRRRLRVDNTRTLLDVLNETIESKLKELHGDNELPTHICRDKLEEMKSQLEGGYTSFWTR